MSKTTPCRTCLKWDESGIDIVAGVLWGARGECRLGHRPESFEPYGADDQADGQALCAGYQHSNEYW